MHSVWGVTTEVARQPHTCPEARRRGSHLAAIFKASGGDVFAHVDVCSSRTRLPTSPASRAACAHPNSAAALHPPRSRERVGGDIVGGPVEPDAHERPAVTEASALKTCGAWCAKRTASTMSPQRQEHVRSSLPTRPLRCRLRN